jgi:multidrug efflux pump
MDRGQLYDVASTILAQSIAQVDGVGQVDIVGSSLPSVRVELNPTALNQAGIGTTDVRNAIVATNVNRPKGSLEDDEHQWQIAANDQATKAVDYMPLVVTYRKGAAVRLSDVATVTDSVQDLRNAGLADGKPAVLLRVWRQPGANVVETVDRAKAILPMLRASIPHAIDLTVMSDSTTTIRASLREVERTLLIAVALVIMVVFLFLRRWRTALIPAVAVPVSLVGTFGVMYLMGYSVDNLSLMALTIATGFVVDDAVVVLENVSRHIEEGMTPFSAALQGAKEVGFTVLSMSISLVAVFVPILLMGGYIGRLFREFAVTLSAAILVSLVVSLTTTPMMCARLLRPESEEKPGRISRFIERFFNWLHAAYERSLRWALLHRRITLATLLGTVALNIYLYVVIPKGFMPQQDTGRINGTLTADQSISFQAMQQKLTSFLAIIQADPAVDHVLAFTGGGNARNAAFFPIILKPIAIRKIPADQVITRLRRQLAHEPGATLVLQADQDVRVGSRRASAQYQYTLAADDLNELRAWEPRIRSALNGVAELRDVNTDQQDRGLQTTLVVDRDTATRLGVSIRQLDSTLNDLYGQRLVSTIYNPRNQYRVVMEAAPQYWQNPSILSNTYVTAAKGAQVPLSTFAHWETTNTSLAVNHQGQFVATTVSFNLAPGVSLSTAARAVEGALQQIGLPSTIRGSFQGTAQVFQTALASQPLLILAALVTVYLVLGILYESLIHPLTIISTLTSAGSGALLALLSTDTEFTIIAFIGVMLLVGIVKKNAILMIDFAIDEQRRTGAKPQDAIYRACLLRFRPILMTTMAAMLGAVPLALGHGDGAELRQPLGISIVGGLAASQILTLYTTPVVYLYMERFSAWSSRLWSRNQVEPAAIPSASRPGL